MNAKPTERIIPPRYKYIVDATFVLRLTWRERLKVLLGYAIDIRYLGRAEHSPGKMGHEMIHTVTNKF